MFGIWIALLVAAVCIVILLGGKAYWSFLVLYFVPQERASEVHTVVTRDVWELKMFRYRRGRTNGEPVLLVHGMCVNHHNFTEPEGACLIDELVARGYDCWALDTRLCQTSKPAFERSRETATIDDILLYDLPAAIRHIRKATSFGRVHWVGHSLGGMLLYAYVQHWGPALIASGTTLGSPIGFDDTKLKLKKVPAVVRKYPNEVANVIRALVPILFFLRLRSKLFPMNMKNLHPRMRPSNLFHQLEAPMPAALAQLAEWARTKTWKMLDGKLDVKAGLNTLDVPLLTIYGPRDPFVPVSRAQAFAKALPLADKQFLLLSRENGCQHDYDHCDIAFGVDSTRMVFAPIAKWIEAHPINERIRVEEISEDDVPIRLALNAEQRAEILSGQSYVRVAEPKDEVAAPKELPKSNIEIEIIEEEPATDVPAVVLTRAVKPKTKARPKAKAKAAVKTKAAAPKASTKPVKAKASAKSAPAAKAEEKKPAQKKVKTSLKVTSAKTPKSNTAESKPVAKKSPVKPAAKKALAKAPAAKAKSPKAKPVKAIPAPPAPSTSTPRVTAAPSKAQKHRPSLLTTSAIMSASEALKDLDKKK